MISDLKFKRIEEQIEEIKDSLENGIESPDRILGDVVPSMELMLKTLLAIRGVVESAEDHESLRAIAKLVGTVNFKKHF